MRQKELTSMQNASIITSSTLYAYHFETGGENVFRNLEAEQRRKGLTNSEVAQILNMSRTTYEIKKKNGRFTRPEIVTLLKLFGCKFEYLFDDTPTPAA